MNKLNQIIEAYPEELFLKADGFDDAILGVTTQKQSGNILLVYSMSKCIEILMNRDEMTEEEALEYYYFNVEGSYMGEKTPVWVEDDFLEEDFSEE